MNDQLHPSIPIELMDILNRINDNISEVKDRITRIEAQDHSNSIQSLKLEIDKARDERVQLKVEVERIKTKLAPVLITISLTGAAVIQLVIQSFR
jgi:predicted  nucleic acid-binding Zn-ribbon protein